MSSPTEGFDSGRLLVDPAERIAYESDAGFDRALPDAVFFPETAEDVSAVVRWAAGEGWPIVARGAGTGLSGGAIASRGGVVAAMVKMDRILEIDEVGRTATVEAGVVNLDLAEAVRARGLYFPPDPASGRTACIGGNLGTNAGGPHCFKYGVTANYVLALDVVLADGRLARLGSEAVDAPGVDLCGLVVGGEGTLAVVTGACLRLVGQPPEVRTMMAAFDSLEAAGAAVSAVIAAGLVPAALEVIDRRGMRVIEEFRPCGLPVDDGAVLIAEVDGYEAGLEPQVEEVAALLRERGASQVRIAADEAEREALWFGRKSAAGAMARLAPRYYLTDITVRRSRLAAVLAEIHRICDRHGLDTASFFHAGDGNLHPLIPCDPRDGERMERVGAAMAEIVALCLAEDGSITGEHGVGLEKRDQLAAMYGAAELSAMRDVKQAFDPDGRLNPGKVLPEEIGEPLRAAPVAPGDPATPASGEEAAGLLRSLSREGRTVRIGSAREGERRGADLWLSTAGLAGVRELAAEDLFVTVGAGTPLADLHRALEPHGVLLPLASPWPSSVGGAVASALNAPLRMRYGGVRDLTLATTVALADGRLLRAGRPLVKNVAGYDLTKAFVGSHGTLGLLTEVTLKLVPRPRARRTLALDLDDLATAWAAAETALRGALLASAVVVEPCGEGLRLLVTAEGDAAGVAAELDGLRERLEASGRRRLQEVEESGTRAWQRFLADGAVVRGVVPVKRLEELLRALPADEGQRWFVDCAAGSVYAALPRGADPLSQAARLRDVATSLGGHAVVLDGRPDRGQPSDRWGEPPPAFDVMSRLKRRWDPQGILNPGAFLFD